jgi:hypothetical protein
MIDAEMLPLEDIFITARAKEFPNDTSGFVII